MACRSVSMYVALLAVVLACLAAVEGVVLKPNSVCKSHKIDDDLSDHCPEGYECKEVGLSGHHICQHFDGRDAYPCDVSKEDKWDEEELAYCCLHKNTGCPHSGEAEF